MIDFHVWRKSDSEQERFSDLFEQHYLLMMKEAGKYFTAPEDVEDIVQEAILNLIEKKDKLLSLEPYHQAAYIATTVRNLSISVLRHRKCIEFIPLSELEDYQIPNDHMLDPEVIFTQKVYAEQFRKIWHTLPPEDQVLLGQKYILDETDEEIARDLQIKPSSVRMTLTRARRRAQAKYHQQWKEYRQD